MFPRTCDSSMNTQSIRQTWWLRSGGVFQTGLCVAAGFFGLVGCNAASQFGSFASLQVATPDRTLVWRTARQTMASLGYTLDEADDQSTIRGSKPVSPDNPSDVAGLPRTLSDSGSLRFLARVRVFPSGQVCNVYCRVSLQQQTTETYRLFSSNYTASDVPTDTPIDREAASTARQNTVWSTIRRIRRAERELLDRIDRRLNKPAR